MAQLRCYLNLLALNGERREFFPLIEAVKAVGYDGVQFAALGSAEERSICRKLNMGFAASGRINRPHDAADLAERVAGDGYDCATLHVGWGIESDDEAARLIESILDASQRSNVRFYIETHRATICQDMWRTVQFVSRFPEMRFNGDFSHWYAGQEMVYGGFEMKLRFLGPVLNRVRFLHGRIASPGCIQVPVKQAAPYVEHFQQLWTASFRGFLRSGEADSICFAPELLGPDIYYARIFEGREETDRWEEALKLKEIAEQCFASALCS
jgi:sugar phosphate isomerase/epimerase